MAKGTKHHIAAKLTVSGGPPPREELERIADYADHSAHGETWVALKLPGAELVIRSDSRALLIAVDGKRLSALECDLIDKTNAPPNDVREWYADHEGDWTFYKLRSPRWLECQSFDDLPGRPATGKSASKTFGARNSFAYWDFDGVPGVPPSSSGAADGASTPQRPAGQGGQGTTAGAAQANPARSDSLPSIWCEPSSPLGNPASFPLYGVDFSGAAEIGGRNPKLWIASWDATGISLKCGGDTPGFTRVALAQRILGGPGFWVLDFPFGIPELIGAALGLSTHQSYLDWSKSFATPTVARDAARAAASAVGVTWSTRRAVDTIHGTTWFPLFEQLYRQTITGASDVLHRLRASASSAARVLPFDTMTNPAITPHVVEGFPGHTIRTLGLPATGYKSKRATARAARGAILTALVKKSCLPIPSAVWTRAENDTEGDALDALVLLLAAHRASKRNAAAWNVAGREGWFFD